MTKLSSSLKLFLGIILTFVTILSSFGSTQLLQDDSVWINAGIKTAINNQQPSYIIPAGQYNLSTPIVIPPGTHDFSLIGAGSNNTVFNTTMGKLNYIIAIGSIFNPYHNNVPVSISNVKENDSTITVPVNTNIVLNKFYGLHDNYRVSSGHDVAKISPRIELIRFIDYNPTTGVCKLEYPASRDFNVNPAITSAEPYACQNITVSGVALNGQINGTTIDASDCLVNAWFVDKITLNDCVVNTFHLAGIILDGCRNAKINNCVVNHAVMQGPGEGYGIYIKHCRFFTITNSKGDNCRHVIVMHSGSTDGLVDSCTATGANGNIDAHGFDERRITIKNCTTSGTINLGNDKWYGGEKNIIVTNCNIGTNIVLGPNTTNVKFSNCTMNGIKPSSFVDPTSNPPGGHPDRIQFNSCTFKTANNTFFINADNIGLMTFKSCYFTNTNTSWGNMFTLEKTNLGSLVFDLCNFKTNSTRGNDQLFSITGGNKLSLSISNSIFYSQGGASSALNVTPTFTGNIKLNTNIFYSSNAKNPVFFINTSTGVVNNLNNTSAIY